MAKHRAEEVDRRRIHAILFPLSALAITNYNTNLLPIVRETL